MKKKPEVENLVSGSLLISKDVPMHSFDVLYVDPDVDARGTQARMPSLCPTTTHQIWQPWRYE
jgi:hypothetical protein